MYSFQYFVHAQPMAHGTDVFRDQLPRVFPGDGGAEYPVLARHGQYLDHAVSGAICNGAVQILEVVTGDFVVYAFFHGLRFVQADPGNLGLGKRGPGYDGIIHAEFLQRAEQGIDSGIPGLM